MPKNVETRTYHTQQIAMFHKTNERFGGLSNMAPGFPITVNNRFIRTSEALYQACRFPHLPEIQQLVIEQTSPMTAKMYARKHLQHTREDWDSVRVALMRWCLRAKLLQNQSTFGGLLLATEDLPIVEYSTKDAFWGAKPQSDGTLVGKNVLGRLLMELRELYSLNKIDCAQLKPLNVSDFNLFGEKIQTLTARLNDETKVVSTAIYNQEILI